MNLTRRQFIKRIAAGAAGVVGISAFGYSYAWYVEPRLLSRQAYVIEHPKVPRAFHNFKILQFSDTHLGFHYDLDQLEKLVQTINEEEPDMLLFTGDLVDEPQTYPFPPRLVEVLKKLQAPRGKYWIYGNHDHGGYGTEKIQQVMEASGFQLLQNEHRSIKNGDASFILAGLDDVMLGKPDIARALYGVDEERFTLLMVHEPDVADRFADRAVDLQLSGHSHGGQVQLPLIGHLITPPYADKYVEGHYAITENFDLYVSRGIGTTRLPYRFLCRPEYSVFQLKHQGT